MAKFKICIDPGHYGEKYNKGAIAGYYESAVMWNLGMALKKALQELGCDVIMSKTHIQSNPTLTARGKSAAGCDCFISLHSDAAADSNVTRCTVFYLVPGSANSNASKTLAQLLADAVGNVMEMSKKIAYRESDTHPGRNYYTVLDSACRNANVPAVLVEHGFHSCPETASWLLKTANIKKLAKAEAKAILQFLSGSSATTPEEVKETNKTITLAPAEKKESVSGKYKVTANSGLRMRTSPEDGEILQTVKSGCLVQYYGYYSMAGGTKWMLCVYDNKTGYMSAEYLRKI